MKKSVFAIALVLVTLLSFSCGGKKESDTGNQGVATQIDASGKVKEVVLVPSVLFYEEGSLWSENSKGELVWFVTLNQGQTLYAYPASAESESEVVEIRKMKKEGKTAEDNYLKVAYDGKDYWILSDLVIPNSTARIVIEDSINYTKDDIDGVSSVKVPAGKIVAVHNDYSSKADADMQFVKVTWRKGTERSYRDVYLKADVVSTKDDDMTALRVINKLTKIEDPVVYDELLENVKSLDISDFLREQLW